MVFQLPSFSASCAVICAPVRHISMALDLPTLRMSRWVPPAPGIVPIVISGCPNLAFSPAMIMSHIMANSQPPPSWYKYSSLSLAFCLKSRFVPKPYCVAVNGSNHRLLALRNAVPVAQKVGTVHFPKFIGQHFFDVGTCIKFFQSLQQNLQWSKRKNYLLQRPFHCR